VIVRFANENGQENVLPALKAYAPLTSTDIYCVVSDAVAEDITTLF